ncbi:O-antigen ligase family protein [Desulfobacterales bacterium HSG17]|nr:O-antigen ligase family protein [Desulfobacterales bacterium HSG17]
MLAQKIVRFIIYFLLIFTPLARASVQGWAVCIIHIMTLIGLTVFFVDRALRWDWKWIRTPLDMPILAIICLSTASTIFSTHQYTSIQSILLQLNYIAVFYLVIHTIGTRSQFRQIVYVILGVGTFLSVFGLIKQSGFNPFPWWEYTNIGQNIRRLSATYGNPDHLAGYMEMAIPVGLGFLITGIKEGKRVLLVFAVLLMVTALIFSMSRGGWIGLLLGLFFMAIILIQSQYFKYKKITAGLILCFLVIALVIISSTDVVMRAKTFEQGEDVVDNRVTVWKGILDMIPDYALLGSGPGTFAFVFTQYQPPGLRAHFTMAHNDFLHFLSELGFAFIIIAVWIILMFYWKGLKKMQKKSRLVRGVTLGSMSGITAMLIHSAGDFNLHIPANALLFSCIAALTLLPSFNNKQMRMYK